MCLDNLVTISNQVFSLVLTMPNPLPHDIAILHLFICFSPFVLSSVIINAHQTTPLSEIVYLLAGIFPFMHMSHVIPNVLAKRVGLPKLYCFIFVMIHPCLLLKIIKYKTIRPFKNYATKDFSQTNLKGKPK